MQPWCAAMIHLHKDIENRVEESSVHKALMTYREPFLLHASAGVGTKAEFDDACEFIKDTVDEEAWCRFRDEFLDLTSFRHQTIWQPRAAMPLAGIVGVARCVGLITPMGFPHLAEGKEADRRYRPNMRWKMSGQWGHILTDVRAVPFVPCNGMLGLWNVPAAVMARVQL